MARPVTCYVWDDMWSHLHTVLGILTRVLAIVDKTLAVLLFILFLSYETLEDTLTRRHGRAKCDILEYMTGYILADIILT